MSGFALFACAGCDTSPDVVSFNTPELCELERTNIPSFTSAQEACDLGCQICIESTYDEHALTYALAADDNCVCPAPALVPFTALDASAVDAQADNTLDSGTTGDAAVVWSDAATRNGRDGGAAPSEPPPVAPDGCLSQLNLSQSGAAAYCADKQGCEVCVERVDFDNEARRYMAHECGCPSPYRLE